MIFSLQAMTLERLPCPALREGWDSRSWAYGRESSQKTTLLAVPQP
jgi:hypothetical protein